MRQQATRDTRPELALRQLLHARGLRYRVHVRPVPELRRTADIVFTKARVTIFVDGCFWHCCPDHGTFPTANAAWWKAKLDRNVDRDAETDRVLRSEGWVVIRIWEHEAPDAGAARIAEAVAERKPRHRSFDKGLPRGNQTSPNSSRA